MFPCTHKQVKCSTNDIQCQYLIPAFNARATRADYTTERLIATHFPGHRCMYDLTNERSLDSQGKWFIDVLGLLSDMLSMCFVQPGTGRHPDDWYRDYMSVLYMYFQCISNVTYTITMSGRWKFVLLQLFRKSNGKMA